jgi:AcrR family transcriptional regulator
MLRSSATRARARKKAAERYHHGDLRRALLDEALRTVQVHGVAHLTLRSVGQKLGVSRSALYRHFASKQALLAAVGSEGFRKLREALAHARERNGRGRAGFEAMGKAYVEFALAYPSHYRVMFGGYLESSAKDKDFTGEAKAAFQVLVDAIVDQQNAGLFRGDDPVLMARYTWAVVHGVSMLLIDDQIREGCEQALELYAIERLCASLANAD